MYARKRIYIKNSEKDQKRVEKEIDLQQKVDHPGYREEKYAEEQLHRDHNGICGEGGSKGIFG